MAAQVPASTDVNHSRDRRISQSRIDVGEYGRREFGATAFANRVRERETGRLASPKRS
jgi:hypothetical protein